MLCYRIPWFQWPIIYEIRARPKMMTSPTGSKDLQMVNIGLRVLHRPSESKLPEMYRQLGLDYDDRVLPSICNEVSIIALLLYLTMLYTIHVGTEVSGSTV